MKKIDAAILENIWAQVPPDYYFHLNYFQSLWHEWKWLIIKHLASSDSFSPRKILEVGCAGGHLSALLSQLFPQAKVTGIDVYEPALAEARKRFPKLTFKKADALNLPFPDESFDLVVSSETIEHVTDPGKMLSETERVISKNGRGILEMDRGAAPLRIIGYCWPRLGRGVVWRDAHLHPFTARQLQKIITSNGFVIQKKIFSHFGMAVSFLVAKKK